MSSSPVQPGAATTVQIGASGRTCASTAPQCALRPATGLSQPDVHLFDNGGLVPDVSVNGAPLTQLGATRPQVPVVLRAVIHVITAANGTLSTDASLRDGGSGSCTL